MVKIVIQVRFSLHPVELNSCFADLPNVFAPHPKIPFINSTDISEIEISKSITILWMTCQKHVLNLVMGRCLKSFCKDTARHPHNIYGLQNGEMCVNKKDRNYLISGKRKEFYD